MPRRLPPTALIVLAAALTGCGSGSAAPAPQVTHADAVPVLATRAPAAGEILVRGEASPLTRGPYAFDGTYTVRFVQYEPAGAAVDFARQTAFVAALEHPASAGMTAVRLFRTAAASGRTRVTVHGRYLVDVSFGDFPFAVRFTPRR